MKTNKTFWAAVDWYKVHGYDLYNQFSADEWAAAVYYVTATHDGVTRSDALRNVRAGIN